MCYNTNQKTKVKLLREGELHSTEVRFLLLTQQPQVQFLAILKFILMLLRFIEGTGYRKVDRGLKMLMQPIFYWLVVQKIT